MSNEAAAKGGVVHTGPAPKTKQPNPWNVRDSLGSLETIRKYDEYIADHKRRLRQLEKEARGDMSPSDEWYRE